VGLTAYELLLGACGLCQHREITPAMLTYIFHLKNGWPREKSSIAEEAGKLCQHRKPAYTSKNGWVGNEVFKVRKCPLFIYKFLSIEKLEFFR
jgi:hypothetical protein